MAAADPRRLAFEVLERVAAGAFCDVLVGDTLARRRLEPRDAALFTRLVYGTVTWQGRLDWTIAGLARRPVEQLDGAVRTALRLGLFQLLHLDRVPAHAAVDTSVELAKRAAGAGAARFVNAVLRAAAREGERALPSPREDAVHALAVRWSHPSWLVARWLEELGPERTASLCAANDEPAPTALRVDLRRRSRDEAIAELGRAGAVARPGRFAATAVVLAAGAPAALELPWAMPQGEASQLVAALVGAAAGERIADVCAAPGGKAAAMAESLAPGDGLVVASDCSRAGMRRVRALAAGEPPRAIAPLRADATAPPFAAGTFDAVLLDAPCSGLGTLRSHPEIRWRRTPEQVSALAARQRRMLAAAARLVRPGGRLVYSTCTLLREENEEVVGPFLAAHPAWSRTDAREVLPPAAAELVDAEGALRTAPDRGALDGFFAVRLTRR
jgi:16S rRNA (cytosine967-C5)-methyltransferase